MFSRYERVHPQAPLRQSPGIGPAHAILVRARAILGFPAAIGPPFFAAAHGGISGVGWLPITRGSGAVGGGRS